jgi:hypothetical protein
MCSRRLSASWLVLFIVVFSGAVRSISKGDFQTRILAIGVQQINRYRLDDLLVVSIATEQTDGYHQYVRSLKIYGFRYEVIT